MNSEILEEKPSSPVDLRSGSPSAKVLYALLSQILGHDARMCSQHNSSTHEKTPDRQPTTVSRNPQTVTTRRIQASHIHKKRNTPHGRHTHHRTTREPPEGKVSVGCSINLRFNHDKKNLFHWANSGFSVERHWNHGFVFVSLATEVFTLERGGRQRFTSTRSVGFAWVSQHSCVEHSFLSCGFHPFCPSDLCRFMTLRSSTASH